VPQVKVNFKPIQGVSRRAHFDGIPVTFDEDEANKKIAAGEHAFTWFIYAAPGTGYTVKVSTEADPKLFVHTAIIGADMKDSGIQWLNVS
jgi:hypothetical protein